MHDRDDASPLDLPRTIGFFPAAGIMIGVALGSGIFRTPASIARELSSPAVVLGMWTLGGVLSLFGALTYAELASAYPRSGGLYDWLSRAYGPRLAFVFGWTYMLITKPAAAAAIPTVFAEYLAPIVRDHLGVTIDPKLTVCAVLVGLTWLNTRGLRLGAGVGVVLTGIKIASLVAIVALVVLIGWLGLGSGARASVSNFHAEPAQIKPVWLAIVPVMSAILWTYDGWADVGAVAGEVRDPQRTLPRVFLLGTLALIAIYVVVNAAYLSMVPLSQMRTSPAVAGDVMQRLVGPAGAVVLSLMVVVSTLGSTHGSIITGARVTYAQARDGLLFRVLGRVHPRYRTPALALWTQCGLSITALLLFDNFESLAGVFVFSMWIFYGLAAASVFVLRVKDPATPRPYRCWGYPVVPGLFLLAAAGMTALTVVDAANEAPAAGALPGLWKVGICAGVLLAGAPMYTVWRRLTGRRTGGRTGPA